MPEQPLGTSHGAPTVPAAHFGVKIRVATPVAQSVYLVRHTLARLFALVADVGRAAGVLGISAVARVPAAVATVPQTFRCVVLAVSVATAVTLAISQPLLELDIAVFGYAFVEVV